MYDLGSTHGVTVNKKPIPKKMHVEIHVGDVVRFGQSSRLYVLTGPADLLAPEKEMVFGGRVGIWLCR